MSDLRDLRGDYVLRFLFEELEIRGRLVCLGAAWRRMREGRGYPEPVAALLGHTTALAVLLGVNQKGAGRVTLQLQGSGPVRLLVADCTAELKIRGMAACDPGAGTASERALLGDGRLALTLEDLRSGRFYQSLLPLEGETLQEIFAHYLAQSEQLPAHLRLAAGPDALCGLLLEKLPAAEQHDAQGWERVRGLATALRLDAAREAAPGALLTALFPGELLRVFRPERVEYDCPYDPAKVREILRALGRAELESILAEQGEVVVKNEMCNHEYRFDARGVAELFAAPQSSSLH